jgi:hypothetical protein
LEPFVDSTNEGPDDRDCVLTMVLSRDVNRCSMYATVSGDVDGLYFGDVAYFNTFDETVPMAAGNAMDPGTMALLDQLLSMAGGVPAGAGGNPPPADAPPPTQDTPPPTQEPPPDRGGIPPATWGEMLQQWAAEDAGDASTPQSGKFGLTLSNVLLPSGGPFGGNAVFSLGAVGPGMEAADAADGFISVPLSRIDLLPGFDAMEGVKFIWEAGKPGSASLTVVPAGENAMIGTLRADLVSERQYGTEGYLEIRLEARFVALRGSLACMQ